MATQTERREGTRSAVIEAAYAAFEANGGPDVSMEAIATRAGVTKGAIHYHFENRAGLLAAVAIWTFQGIEARVAAALEDAPPEERTTAYVRALLSEQAQPVGRVLFTIGDELARMGRLDRADPLRYLRAKLAELGVEGSAEILAAAVIQLGRQLALGLAGPDEIDRMLGALRTGGRLRAP